MKKTKLFSALALASCVMLSGCNKKPEQPTSNPELTVADLPHLVAGEQFDVSSYITAQGGSGSVSIEIDASCQDFASVDASGKKITALHSGEVKFTVKYGELSVQCTAAVDSKEYLAYKEATKEEILEYVAYDFTSQGALDFIYCYSEDLFLGFEDDEYFGYYQFEDQIYSYELNLPESESEEPSLSIKISGYEPDDLSEYCAPYGLPASKGAAKYVSEEEDTLNVTPTGYECISFTDKDSLDFACMQIIGYDPDSIRQAGITLDEVQVLPEEYVDDETGEEGTAYYVALFITGPANLFYETTSTELVQVFFGGYAEFEKSALLTLVEQLLPEGKPEGVDTKPLFDVVSPLLEAHDYGIFASFGWYDTNYAAVEENPFLDMESPTLGQYVHDFMNARGEFAIGVSEDEIAVYSGSYVTGDIAYRGLVNHTVGEVGNVYAFQGTEIDKLEASLIAEDTEIFKDEEIAASPISMNFLNDLSKTFFNEYDSTYDTYVTSFAAAYDVLSLFASVLPTTLPIDPDAEIETWADLVPYSFDFVNMLAFTMDEMYMGVRDVSVSYDAGEETLYISIAIPEQYTDPTTQQTTTYIYMINMYVYAFGSGQDFTDYYFYGMNINYPETPSELA